MVPPVIPHATAVVVGSASRPTLGTGHVPYAPFVIVFGAIAAVYLLRLAFPDRAGLKRRR
jgi:hypothetical protein